MKMSIVDLSKSVDLSRSSVRALNEALHTVREGTHDTLWTVLNPNGEHSIAAGADAPITINIQGSVGYFCGGMNKHANNRD